MAIKRIKYIDSEDESYEQCVEEANILSHVNHPNVMKVNYFLIFSKKKAKKSNFILNTFYM